MLQKKSAHFLRVAALVLCLAALLFSAACAPEEGRASSGSSAGAPVSLALSGKETYYLEDDFSPADLTVQAVYADGSTQVLQESAYNIDRSGLDTRVPGEGKIVAALKDGSLRGEMDVRVIRPYDSLKVLAIGNSFSDDSLQYFYGVAEDCGAEEISLGNLYIPGCTLETHAANVRGNKAAYTFRTNDSGTWKNTNNYSISRALEYDDWDIISLQQGSPVSGMAETYNQDLLDIVLYLKSAAPDAMLVWNMTWAYTSHADFGNYDNDQMKMYNAIVNAVRTKIEPTGAFRIVIPTGTTVQNLRTAWIGDTVTRDGYHLTYDIGRYAAAMTWVKSLTGWDVNGVTYIPEGQESKLTPSKVLLVKECVENAWRTPYAVTPSQYATDPDAFVFDPADYDLFDWQPVEQAYWYACHPSRYNRLITFEQDKDALAKKYCSSAERFTKEDLPVGSVIVIESGWQYRPEGWSDPDKPTDSSARAANVSGGAFLVSDAFWQEFPCRAFNVSRQDNKEISDFSRARSALKIYIPKA